MKEKKKVNKNKSKILISIILIFIIVFGGIFISKKLGQLNRNYEIQSVQEYNYFVVKENNKYGVINKQGDKIVDATYDNVKIPNPSKAIFVCYLEDKANVLNENGEQIFSEYENVEPLRLQKISGDLMYEKSVLKYMKDEKYGIIDFSGKKITEPIYESIETLTSKEGELVAKKDGKVGIININGNVLVKFDYDEINIDQFYEEGIGYKNAGYIVSEKTEEGYRYGYVDLQGKELVKTQYNDLYRITETESNDIYLICALNGKYCLIKNGDKIVENEYQSIIYNQSNSTIVALKGKKYGVLSMDGKVIVPFEYKQIDIIGKYIYAKKTEDDVKVFDSNGEETNMSEKVAILEIPDTNYKIYMETNDSKTVYSILKNDEKITKNEYMYIEYLFNNYFIACNNDGKLGIINDLEETKADFKYTSMKKIKNAQLVQAQISSDKLTTVFSRDIELIKEMKDAKIENFVDYIKMYNNNEEIYIKNSGEKVENTEVFENNKLFVKKQDKKYGYVDKNGQKVVDFIYDDATEINEYGFGGIKQDGKWGVIDAEGKVIVAPQYEISGTPIFINQYYQVIYGNGEIYYTNNK